ETLFWMLRLCWLPSPMLRAILTRWNWDMTTPVTIYDLFIAITNEDSAIMKIYPVFIANLTPEIAAELQSPDVCIKYGFIVSTVVCPYYDPTKRLYAYLEILVDRLGFDPMAQNLKVLTQTRSLLRDTIC